MASLKRTNSVFQAEACGIEANAKILSQWNTKNSDSQATIKSLQKTKITSETIRNCNNALINLANNQNRVTVSWIPGHKEHEGNELAYTLAKIRANSSHKIHNIKTPHKTITSHIKKHYSERHTLKWNFSDLHRNCAYPINILLKKYNSNLAALKNSRKQEFQGNKNLNLHFSTLYIYIFIICKF